MNTLFNRGTKLTSVHHQLKNQIIMNKNVNPEIIKTNQEIMEALQQERKLNEGRELVNSELHKYILENTINYVTNISWGLEIPAVRERDYFGVLYLRKNVNKKNDFKICNNGTAFLLNLGEETFLVTAAHVYEAYLRMKSKVNLLNRLRLKQKKEEIKFRCIVGETQIDLEDRLICSLGSKILDISTFKVTNFEIEELKKLKKIIHTPLEFPTERVTKDAGVLFGGFPGEERKWVDTQEYQFGLYTAFTPVTTSNDRDFTCQLDRTFWIDTLGKGLPATGYDMGGVSGGPAFLIKTTNGGILTISLVGVIYNATTSFGADLLKIQHSSFILSNGMLTNPNIIYRED